MEKQCAPTQIFHILSIQILKINNTLFVHCKYVTVMRKHLTRYNLQEFPIILYFMVKMLRFR